MQKHYVRSVRPTTIDESLDQLLIERKSKELDLILKHSTFKSRTILASHLLTSLHRTKDANDVEDLPLYRIASWLESHKDLNPYHTVWSIARAITGGKNSKDVAVTAQNLKRHFKLPLHLQAKRVPKDVQELQTKIRDLEAQLVMSNRELEKAKEQLKNSIPATAEFKAMMSITEVLKDCPSEARGRVLYWAMNIFRD